MVLWLLRAAGCALLMLAPAGARAEIAVVSNDAHTVLDDGKQVTPKNAVADTVAIISLADYPPKVIGTAEAPGSVVGPPTAVAVAPDESWAVVTSATKAEAAGPGGIAPDDRVSVIDLAGSPPKVIQSLRAGAGATTVRFTPDMKLALVANRTGGHRFVVHRQWQDAHRRWQARPRQPKSGSERDSGAAGREDGAALARRRQHG